MRIPMTTQDNFDDGEIQMDSGFQGDDPNAFRSVASKEKYALRRSRGELSYENKIL